MQVSPLSNNRQEVVHFGKTGAYYDKSSVLIVPTKLRLPLIIYLNRFFYCNDIIFIIEIQTNHLADEICHQIITLANIFHKNVITNALLIYKQFAFVIIISRFPALRCQLLPKGILFALKVF